MFSQASHQEIINDHSKKGWKLVQVSW
ncbi:DUF4177 domain-containing protein [Chengkuizengella sediminis]